MLESNIILRGTTSVQTDTTNVIYVGSLSCGAFDVIPWIHRPVTDQPTTVLMSYVDETVEPPKNWVLTVAVVSPLRFEIGTRAQSFSKYSLAISGVRREYCGGGATISTAIVFR